jgi:protein-L-isoaspartate(D-aspartate) O-methyltransferase
MRVCVSLIERMAHVKIPTGSQFDEYRFSVERARMVREQLAMRGINDERVLEAMGKTPRHLFVPPEVRAHAYDDGPLPIGAGQTISQPYIVALMTQLIQPTPNDRVLEVGCGSGYQAAVLAEIVREVIGLERIGDLALQTGRLLERLGYHNVAVHIRDGTEGYAEAAPYDAIIVSAAAPEAPEPLIAQLAEGGRLIVPVGDETGQVIERIRRRHGRIEREKLIEVRFVPLIGKHGFKKGWGWE